MMLITKKYNMWDSLDIRPFDIRNQGGFQMWKAGFSFIEKAGYSAKYVAGSLETEARNVLLL